ncbi:fimbrial biogenesis outer membrane usher protein [Pluralibacter gergoviae]
MAVPGAKLAPLAMCIVLIYAGGAKAERGDDLLPPPPSAAAVDRPLVYQLTLVINHYDTGQTVPATRRGGGWFVARDDLTRGGLPGDKLPAGEVDLSALPEVRVSYDDSAQRLLLAVPDEWFAARDTPFQEAAPRVRPEEGSGALLNYDLYTSRDEGENSRAALWHEARLFSGRGAFSSSGTLRKSFSGGGGQQEGEDYVRYDTGWRYSNDDSATSWDLGDTLSDALSWSSSVRMGGVRFGRDFSLRPDLVTWPLPTFSGSAAVPTAADVFINGSRAGSTELQPGPFSLTNLPYVNGAGEAVLVTTDALGRQVSTTLPFYVASELLKPGLSDGAITLGALRRSYGIDSFDYGPLAGSGSWRHGVSDFFTLESHAEGAGSLALAGGGGLLKIGQYGIVNASLTGSQMDGDAGRQHGWGYQYSNGVVSLGTQHIMRNSGFGNLALYDQRRSADSRVTSVASLSQRSDQYSLSFNLGGFGSLGTAWIGVRSFDGQKTSLLSLSWSRSLWRGSSLNLAASRDKQQGAWNLGLSVQVPLGRDNNVAFSTRSAPGAGSSQRVDYSRSMPTDGGYSWNMAWARQSRTSNYQQASLGWRNSHIELLGGGYGESNSMNWWGEAMGSLVMMDGQLFAANRIDDAFAVVSTSGQAGIPVSYEHQPVGTTNSKGYLLVSRVSSWYPASYSINGMDLPAESQLKQSERRVALRRNSGSLINFEIDTARAASVILHDARDRPLPVSSRVSRPGRPDVLVGYDGMAWLEDLRDENPLTVTTPQGARCRVTLVLQPNPERRMQTYGPLVCREAP